jgi:hypothetical protein
MIVFPALRASCPFKERAAHAPETAAGDQRSQARAEKLHDGNPYRIMFRSRERAQLARDSRSTSTQVWQGMGRRIEEFAVSNYLQLAA